MKSKTHIAHLSEDHYFLKIPHVSERIERCKKNSESYVFTIESEENEVSGKLSMYTVSEGDFRHEITLKTNFEGVERGSPFSIEKFVSQLVASERYGI
jgi:hypothetical protein